MRNFLKTSTLKSSLVKLRQRSMKMHAVTVVSLKVNGGR
ncbi:hypothetical protein ACSQ67_015940 [Phaseolus vulgaris]